MAFGFTDLATGALNSASKSTIYTAPAAGAKMQELTLGNETGADVDCSVYAGGKFFGKWTVPGADKVQGNQTTITRNKALTNGQLVELQWASANANLTHHLSGTVLG